MSALALAVVLGVALLAALPERAAAATTLVVNRTGDAADLKPGNGRCDVSRKRGRQCTLRAAIQEGNALGGKDTIKFNIKGSATTKVIAPLSPLPPITAPAIINGYSQAGAAANTKAIGNDAVLKIVLDGTNAGNGANGLEIQANKVKVKGLVIQHWHGSGMLISGNNNVVRGNFIGTGVTGTQAAANRDGIVISGGSANLVGGRTPAARNVISGNFDAGVSVNAGIANDIFGNYIGTTKAGTAALGNGLAGVVIHAPRTRVGGDEEGTGNVVSGNAGPGIVVVAVSADNSATIRRNLVGTDASGQLPLANEEFGVACVDSRQVVIGGSMALGNVISGNGIAGVGLMECTGVRVRGNSIGTNLAGSVAVGSQDAGIYITGGNSTTIGGSRAKFRNVISGNGIGIFIYYGSGGFHTVTGNLIGTTADGSGDLGNDVGIWTHGQGNNVIGGTGAAGNLIAFSEGSGIVLDSEGNTVSGNVIRDGDVTGIIVWAGPNTISGNAILENGSHGVLVAPVTGIRISANRTAGNGGLGVDLPGGTEDSFYVTANDPDDPDTGANNFQNYPVLTSAIRNGGTGVTTVEGSLDSLPSTEFRIELFVADADPSGHGEGDQFLASELVTTDAGGDASFSVSLGNLLAGQEITATAINTATGDTSEFGANFSVANQ